MHTSLRFLYIGLLAMLHPLAAHAYVDPGSGMLLWQGLIAAIGAVIVFWRRLVQQLKRWLERLRTK